MLRYIRDNKNLGLIYYSKIEDATLSDILIQASIKTYNQLMAFYGSIWKEYTYTRRSTGSYIVFYQGGLIDYCTHVTCPVAQSSSESEYNEACTAGMALPHFRMIDNKFMNKDTYVVPEQAPLIILYSKSSIYMTKNGKDTKHTIHIPKIMNFETINSAKFCKRLEQASQSPKKNQ